MSDMFINPKELDTVIHDYQLAEITEDENIVKKAILASIAEATSYLSSKYDCNKIFAARGENRNPILLEHCKSIAVWYLIRRSNIDLIHDRIKDYYKEAVMWLARVAGVSNEGRSITPDLPLLQDEQGNKIIKMRMGSHAKFDHGL